MNAIPRVSSAWSRCDRLRSGSVIAESTAPATSPISAATPSAARKPPQLGSPDSAVATNAPVRNSAPCARLSTSIIPNTSESPTARMKSRNPKANPLITLTR